MTAKTFVPLFEPYIYGYKATRADGLTVEVVRHDFGYWRVYLTRDRHVVACSTDLHWHEGLKKTFRGVHFQTAMRIAKDLV